MSVAPGARTKAVATPRAAPFVPSAAAATSALQLSARAVRDPAEIESLVPAWRELAASAGAANPFFEPWMLLPALRDLRGAAGAVIDVDIVIVEGRDPARPEAPPTLCALAPFAQQRRWRGLPVEARVLWWYRHCYLGTPLVRAGQERSALAAFLDWGAQAAPLLELRGIGGAGELHERLVDLLNERSLESVVSGRHTRAIFRPAPGADAERYLAGALSGGKRKELRRQERRLAEQGELSFTQVGPTDDPARFVDEFLALEVLGWKGHAGGALACDPTDRRWFDAVCRGAHAEGRLLMTALRLDGRPIAAKCSILAPGGGAFAVKIAFDEQLARFSPGVLLELDNIRRLHARPDVAWMDSCAAWNHPMINGLWPGRIPIETVLIAPRGAGLGAGVVAAAPLLRRLAHAITAWRTR